MVLVGLVPGLPTQPAIILKNVFRIVSAAVTPRVTSGRRLLDPVLARKLPVVARVYVLKLHPFTLVSTLP